LQTCSVILADLAWFLKYRYTFLLLLKYHEIIYLVVGFVTENVSLHHIKYEASFHLWLVLFYLSVMTYNNIVLMLATTFFCC